MDSMLNGFLGGMTEEQVLEYIMYVLPFLVLLSLVDVVLKGWGMWRAAKMHKAGWFIALLLVNSMGILPAIFLFLTRDEYAKKSVSPLR